MVEQATVQQRSPNIVADGVVAGLRQSSVRQLYTADWKTELVLAGKAFNVTVGGITAGAAELLITGGGSGTVINSDQPELVVGIDAGHYMIPLGFTCAARVDVDADTETGNIILFADTTQAPVASVTGVVESPASLLDSGKNSSIARAFSAITADITDPVASIVLGFATIVHAVVTAAGEHWQELRLDYDPSFPMLLKGPCQVVACWGGTAAVPAIASFSWAEVSLDRYE